MTRLSLNELREQTPERPENVQERRLREHQQMSQVRQQQQQQQQGSSSAITASPGPSNMSTPALTPSTSTSSASANMTLHGSREREAGIRNAFKLAMARATAECATSSRAEEAAEATRLQTSAGSSSASVQPSVRSSATRVQRSSGSASRRQQPSVGSSSSTVQPSISSSTTRVQPSVGSSPRALQSPANSTSTPVQPSAGLSSIRLRPSLYSTSTRVRPSVSPSPQFTEAVAARDAFIQASSRFTSFLELLVQQSEASSSAPLPFAPFFAAGDARNALLQTSAAFTASLESAVQALEDDCSISSAIGPLVLSNSSAVPLQPTVSSVLATTSTQPQASTSNTNWRSVPPASTSTYRQRYSESESPISSEAPGQSAQPTPHQRLAQAQTYPIPLFLYGSLANPSTLRALLSLPNNPILSPATISGYTIKQHNNKPALIPQTLQSVHPEQNSQPFQQTPNKIQGKVYEVANAAEFEKLINYGTLEYDVEGVWIEMDGSDKEGRKRIVRGRTLVWAGEMGELRRDGFWEFERKIQRTLNVSRWT